MNVNERNLTEQDVQILSTYLSERDSDGEPCFDDIETLFAPANEGWKILWHIAAKDNITALKDFVLLKNGFKSIWQSHLEYRKQRIANAADERMLLFGKEIGWSYHAINTAYRQLRKFFAEYSLYTRQQKLAYILLMAQGLISTICATEVDKEFYSYFMESELLKQLLRDRDLILNTLHGEALCTLHPEIFTPDQGEI